MEQQGGLEGIRKLNAFPKEVAYGVLNLSRSLEQKRKADIKEAQDLLSCLEDILPRKNPYFVEENKSFITRRVDSGFHNSCYEFTNATGMGKWVIKIGYDKSPMKTQFHPSTREYQESYLRNLEIQRSVFGNKLPNFIPEPQRAFYVKGKKRATTVIIQPFIDYISPFDRKIKLSQEECQQLRDEFGTLKVLMEKMRRDSGIMLDFVRARGKRGHLVVVRKADGVHLVMLDNGVFDEKRDLTPGLHFFNNILAENSIRKQQKILKK